MTEQKARAPASAPGAPVSLLRRPRPEPVGVPPNLVIQQWAVKDPEEKHLLHIAYPPGAVQTKVIDLREPEEEEEDEPEEEEEPPRRRQAKGDVKRGPAASAARGKSKAKTKAKSARPVGQPAAIPAIVPSRQTEQSLARIRPVLLRLAESDMEVSADYLDVIDNLAALNNENRSWAPEVRAQALELYRRLEHVEQLPMLQASMPLWQQNVIQKLEAERVLESNKQTARGRANLSGLGVDRLGFETAFGELQDHLDDVKQLAQVDPGWQEVLDYREYYLNDLGAAREFGATNYDDDELQMRNVLQLIAQQQSQGQFQQAMFVPQQQQQQQQPFYPQQQQLQQQAGAGSGAGMGFPVAPQQQQAWAGAGAGAGAGMGFPATPQQQPWYSQQQLQQQAGAGAGAGSGAGIALPAFPDTLVAMDMPAATPSTDLDIFGDVLDDAGAGAGAGAAGAPPSPSLFQQGDNLFGNNFDFGREPFGGTG